MGTRLFTAASFTAAAIGVLSAGSASAAVTISAATTQVTLSYNFDGSSVYQDLPIENIGQLQLDNNDPAQMSRILADWTSTVTNDGDFHFLSNVRCIGTCGIQINTYTQLTLSNDEYENQDVRIDSLILPGHIGVQGTAFVVAGYDFNAGASENGVSADVVGTMHNVPNALRDGFDSNYFVYNSESSFPLDLNNFTPYLSGNEAAVDFGATNLGIEATAYGLSQTTVSYNSTLTISSSDVCTDLYYCGGAQVVFGDPRNRGGTSARSSLAAEAVTLLPETVLDRQFGVFDGTYVLSDIDSEPDPQPLEPPPLYDPGPFAFGPESSVPEPSSWAMMMVGLGLIGAGLRVRARPAVSLA